jgi:phosphate transport system protein
MSQAAKVCLDSRERVFALVTAMAGMVEGSIDQAMEALLSGDCGSARAVLTQETVVNCMEMHIDAAVLEYLAQKDLPADDLRSMAAILKINKDLERMGDLAANIARKVIDLGESWKHGTRSELQPMAIAVSHVSRKALRALARHDVILAESTLSSQESVHAYRDYVFHRIRERLAQGSSNLSSHLALLLASRYLEQIAAHAANLAENLVFWLRGKTCTELLAG